MKWKTISPYTRTITFSPFVKRQTISREIYRGSYGKKLINTTRVLSSAQGHPKNENTVWEEKLKNSINLFGDGENCTELHEHAYSEFCFTDTFDIVKYSNELNRSKYREVQNYITECMVFYGNYHRYLKTILYTRINSSSYKFVYMNL